jgi:hypothetical protein
VLEYVSPAKRSMVANMPIALFLTFGLVTLPWLAYVLWDWRLFSVISSLPMCVAFLAPWCDFNHRRMHTSIGYL